MRGDETGLMLPAWLTTDQQRLLVDLTRRNLSHHGDDLLGVVLSGSAGRGLATERSDLDVYVVLTDEGLHDRSATEAPDVDEIPVALSDLERVPKFGTNGWWFRWSFAWAPVLLDRSAGRLLAALHRQATVTPDEADAILLQHDRLDGYLNYAYRALKNDEDGRTFERRLDAAESIPWLLDVIFTLAGRVRPYHKYLPWELTEHPLAGWPAEELMGLLAATLDGDPGGIRRTFARVEAECGTYDQRRGNGALTRIIADWGDKLALLRHA